MLVILFISVFEYTYFCFKSVFEYLPHSFPWPYFHIYIIWSLQQSQSSVDRCGLGLFLLTLVWVRGTSFSHRVLRKHLWQYRWAREARVWVEVRYKAHKPGLRGPRGVSTPLYHRLSVQISLICRVCFYSCTCCLN